jgi:hypothetical protein
MERNDCNALTAPLEDHILAIRWAQSTSAPEDLDGGGRKLDRDPILPIHAQDGRGALLGRPALAALRRHRRTHSHYHLDLLPHIGTGVGDHRGARPVNRSEGSCEGGTGNKAELQEARQGDNRDIK